MLRVEIGGFYIVFSSSAPVLDVPQDYLINIEGNIFTDDDNEEDDLDGMLAGKLKAYYADLSGAFNNGYSPFEILDLDGATEPFYSALFDSRTDQFKRSVSKVVGPDLFDINLLILGRLEILPEYRGGGLGLACLYRCMKQFQHGCGLVALRCFPLQFEALGARREQDPWRQRLTLGALGSDQKILQLGFRDFSPYNAAHHALGLIIGVLDADVAVNRHLWRNDPRAHHQHTIGALINAQNQKR